MIAQLEEENNEMLRDLAALEQQQLLADSSGHLLGLRDRTVELESKMREKQQLRRQVRMLEIRLKNFCLVDSTTRTINGQT